MLKRIFFALAFLCLAATPALAIDVAVSGSSFPNYNYAGATATLRIYASETFLASDGTVIGGGTRVGSTTGFYKSVACTVASNTLTCPSVALKSTTDSLDKPSTTYTAKLFDAGGTARDFFPLSDFRLPHTLGPVVTWSQIIIFNAGHRIHPAPAYYTTEQVNALIASVATNFKGSFTRATLPTSGAAAGWVAWVTDDARGFWLYNGSRWRPVANELNLYDCGAVGDGVTNDAAAIQTCLNLLASSPVNGMTLRVPPGTFRVASPVVVSMGLRGTHAKIEGVSGRSAFYIDVSAAQDAFTFSAAENLSFRDLVFRGHVTDVDDARHALVITNSEQVSFESVQFYGLYAALNGAVVKINNSSVYMRDVAFKGCSGSNLTTAVIRILLHRAFRADNIIFKDFGVWDGDFYSKTPAGLPNWIELNSVQGGALTSLVSDMTNQGEFYINGFRGDEGAINQIAVVIPDGQKELTRATVLNANINLSGLDGGNGMVFDNVDEVRIQDSWLGYSTNPSRIAFTFREVRRAIIRNTTLAEGVSVINFGTSTPYAELENVRFVRVSGTPIDTFITGAWANLLFADSRNTWIKSIVGDRVTEGQAFKLAAAGATSYAHYKQGAIRVVGITKPLPSSVTPFPAGATSYTYWVGAVDRFGRRSISEPFTITNGPAALSGAAFNRVVWPAVGGAVEYRVMRGSPTAYVHVISPVDPTANSFQFDDTGGAADTWFTVQGNESANVETDGNVIADGLILGGGARIAFATRGAATIDPPSIPAGTTMGQTFSVPGAKPGDTLVLNPPSATAGWPLGVYAFHAHVSADGTGTVYLQNTTGGAIDPPSLSWSYTLIR